MRVVLDTNILVSAITSPAGQSARIYIAWQGRRFTLLTCAERIDELRTTLNKPRIAGRIHPHRAGRLVNQLRKLAEGITSMPSVHRSPDPQDDFLLALCEGGAADFLVTGDKSGLLSLGRHKNTQIVSASEFIKLLA